MFIKINIFIRIVRYRTGFSSMCSLLEKVNDLIPYRHCLAGGKCEEIPLYLSTLFVILFFLQLVAPNLLWDMVTSEELQKAKASFSRNMHIHCVFAYNLRDP